MLYLLVCRWVKHRLQHRQRQTKCHRFSKICLTYLEARQRLRFQIQMWWLFCRASPHYSSLHLLSPSLNRSSSTRLFHSQRHQSLAWIRLWVLRQTTSTSVSDQKTSSQRGEPSQLKTNSSKTLSPNYLMRIKTVLLSLTLRSASHHYLLQSTYLVLQWHPTFSNR